MVDGRKGQINIAR